MNENRIKKIRALLADKNADVIIVNKVENIHYFSGFCGEDALLLISPDRAALITDFRYMEAAKREALGFEIIEQKDGLLRKSAEVIKEFGSRHVAFEGGAMTWDEHEKLKEYGALPELSLKLDELRIIKEPEEITFMEKAAEIADRAFSDILNFLRPGLSEIGVATRLEATMRSLGSERPAFATIVASGVRGSLPHGIATEKLIDSGEFVTMDFGAVYHGYHSDMTRTVVIGRANERQREVYDSVLSAQLYGIKEIIPGISGKDADAKVRKMLADSKLGQYFGHGLGHGVGLEIHEEPRLSPKSECESLAEDMIVTCEPGVYIEGWGGVRIEDTLRVTAEGGTRLTKSTKNLIEIN